MARRPRHRQLLRELSDHDTGRPPARLWRLFHQLHGRRRPDLESSAPADPARQRRGDDRGRSERRRGRNRVGPLFRDHLQAYKYEAFSGKWFYAEQPVHQPFYDREWITVLLGPFSINGQTIPYI